ncbi:hypothetical protein PRIPAC_84914 [Pristionchus pacificus]|uniref:Uncharacterized protein n=1 Tax=Pristionchus pacificus TaxID=54126 RepID=A0A2A6BLZ8_PRIPA|nr:hypothetical protein PRIPAC_84914 [Pristionchus pacificus]|eukprot:PDM66929.1 hypothetical protein PRIPAC_48346 [Pristionchus pacificus]
MLAGSDKIQHVDSGADEGGGIGDVLADEAGARIAVKKLPYRLEHCVHVAKVHAGHETRPADQTAPDIIISLIATIV